MSRLTLTLPDELHRALKESAAARGKSIGQYVEEARIETAKRLLLNGDTIKSIAFTMGFASASSFSFAFRRATGRAPKEFRQLL